MNKDSVEFELVKTFRNQRVYKASKKLKNNAKGKEYFGFGSTKKFYTDKTKTETKNWVTPNYFDYVVISDATTHTERLAFPCWDLGEDLVVAGHPFIWECDTIAGVNTFMIYGGDHRAVKPDKVYLRMIAKGNNLQYKRSLENKLNK